MNNGEARNSKAHELLIQISAWTGGILAAAVGGFLVAFGSKDTPPEVLTYFKWAVIPLVLALLGTWYIQIHTALYARELELAQERKLNPPAAADTPKTVRPWYINGSIAFQVSFQTIALLALAIGVWRYKGPSPEPWSLVANQASDQHISYLMKVRKEGKEEAAGTTNLRLLVSDAAGNWRVCAIDPAVDDNRVQCPRQPTSGSSALLRLIADPILFHRLQYKLRYKLGNQFIDLTGEACNAKKAILQANAGGVFVVGSHDRDRVTGTAVDTNESLAQLRAASVAAYLMEDNACGRAVGPVITLNTAPLLATSDVARGRDLAADRSVKVYGLVSVGQ